MPQFSSATLSLNAVGQQDIISALKAGSAGKCPYACVGTNFAVIPKGGVCKHGTHSETHLDPIENAQRTVTAAFDGYYYPAQATGDAESFILCTMQCAGYSYVKC